MKVYWNDFGEGIESACAKKVDLEEAVRIWFEEIHGGQGNFMGLIDDQGRTIQFYFDEGIPDHIDDASYLKIVLLDFPQPEQGGSYSRQVMLGEVGDLIEKAFQEGADYRKFDDLSFVRW